MEKMIDYPNQPSFNTVVMLDTLQSDSPALSFDENCLKEYPNIVKAIPESIKNIMRINLLIKI